MENREILFKKVEEKQKEWAAQIKSLQSKVSDMDFETRTKIEDQINNLNIKLMEIEKKTNELKKTSSEVQHDIGDKIIQSWIEVFTKIDDAMLKLKK
jgi:hypothetical protein